MKVSEIKKEIKKHIDDHFSCISAFNRGKQLGLTYHFIRGKKPVNLTVIFDEDEVIPSITEIFPSAYVYEIEAHEMFGINFDRLERSKLFLSDDWKEGPPLRE